MGETWICWYCEHENPDSAYECEGSCDHKPREWSIIRQEYAKKFPGQVQYYYVEDAIKRLDIACSRDG